MQKQSKGSTASRHAVYMCWPNNVAKQRACAVACRLAGSTLLSWHCGLAEPAPTDLSPLGSPHSTQQQKLQVKLEPCLSLD